jgi:methylated-DNA-[protein]-cysteine S-methyltransferase
MTTTTRLARTTFASPVGPLTVVASADAVVAIRWDTESDARLADAHNPVDGRLGDDFDDPAPGEHAVLDQAVAQLREYFAGTRTTFDLPVAPQGTEFQQQAWGALRGIPYGETISYSEQARRLGDAKKSRAVGAANGRNPIPIVIPCHRVVAADGKLTGFAGGIATKAWLLDHELATARRAQPDG